MQPSKVQRRHSRFAVTILLAVAAAFYAVFIARTAFRVDGRPFFTLVDDAMISMRYAQHLVEGNGLVWNVGEPPIQGFTNPGWVLVMGLLHVLRLPQGHIALGLMAVSAAILVANVLVVHQVYRQLAPTARVMPLLASAVTAFYFPLVFWSLRGMEVGFLVLLVNSAMLAALKIKWAASGSSVILGVLLSLAVLVRLDAVVQAGVVLAYLIGSRRAATRQAILAASFVVVTLVVILIFH